MFTLRWLVGDLDSWYGNREALWAALLPGGTMASEQDSVNSQVRNNNKFNIIPFPLFDIAIWFYRTDQKNLKIDELSIFLTIKFGLRHEATSTANYFFICMSLRLLW